MPVSDYTPDVDDVGSIAMSRTVDDVGRETGTFGEKTRPTRQQVLTLINRAANNVSPDLGGNIPEMFWDDAREIIALRTAMYIELTYFAAEVAQDRSPYPQYKTLFDEQIKKLTNGINAVESGADPANNISTNMAQYSFPAPIDIMQRPF